MTNPTAQSLKERKRHLELTKLELEIREAEASAQKAEYEAEVQKLDVEAERRREKRRVATLNQDSHCYFRDSVNDSSVGSFVNWLAARRLTNPGEPVTVSMYSPGGSVFAGFVMMDAMREAIADGTEITMKITGYGASMAGIIAQAASKRLIGKDSYLMIHEVSQGMFGGFKLSELADEKDFTERLTKQALTHFATRSDGKWTVESLSAKIKKFDWWLSADEALDAGFVDGVF